jgi:hypothetical protein
MESGPPEMKRDVRLSSVEAPGPKSTFCPQPPSPARESFRFVKLVGETWRALLSEAARLSSPKSALFGPRPDAAGNVAMPREKGYGDSPPNPLSNTAPDFGEQVVSPSIKGQRFLCCAKRVTGRDCQTSCRHAEKSDPIPRICSRSLCPSAHSAVRSFSGSWSAFAKAG